MSDTCPECGGAVSDELRRSPGLPRGVEVMSEQPPAENDVADEEVVYGAVARAMALAADDPDWMNVTRWPRPIPAREGLSKDPETA